MKPFKLKLDKEARQSSRKIDYGSAGKGLSRKNDTDAIAEASPENLTGSIPVEAEELSAKEPQKYTWPGWQRLWLWIPFWILIILAAFLRFWHLGDRPLHFDESEHAHYSSVLLQNLQHWSWCYGLNHAPANYACYQYNPLLHGPFQFHIIALVYQISQWLGVPDHGVNNTTARIAAALLGTVIVGLPYFLRDYLGNIAAWLASFFLAVSPSMVYFSRFTREDIYMACFTLTLVVAIARYMREQKIRWIILAAASFALSYATSEATFLTIAIFGSFLGALIV
ncbi:flippase activity-associated protein Agl23 [Ktedonosporobacter rubrisoli]|uniref:flippase activity-associated protein Agl23 n=1 Tax=Ktedonosporobacter rubrisoli TaxID=2509675 RepID=UPI0013EE7E45|nr:flippase activity-associated protein Agl23 [Ktedonosporobacter rubrisoli]